MAPTLNETEKAKMIDFNNIVKGVSWGSLLLSAITIGFI
jgi:hypothetical protein